MKDIASISNHSINEDIGSICPYIRACARVRIGGGGGGNNFTGKVVGIIVAIPVVGVPIPIIIDPIRGLTGLTLTISLERL